MVYPGDVVVSHGPIPPGLPGYREDRDAYGFKPDSARALLAAAGAEVSRSTSISARWPSTRDSWSDPGQPADVA